MRQKINKKLSYRRGTARRATAGEILSTAAQIFLVVESVPQWEEGNVRKIVFSKTCIECMITKVTQGHWNIATIQ